MTYFEFNEKFPTGKSILQHFRTIRYKNGLICPHCGSTQQVGLRTDQPKLCNCNHCHNTFSIFLTPKIERKIMTVFNDYVKHFKGDKSVESDYRKTVYWNGHERY